MGEQVLLLDLDPQGNASTGLGIPKSERSPGTYEFLLGLAPLADCVRASQIPGLPVLLAEVRLGVAAVERVGGERREHRLEDALNAPDSDARRRWASSCRLPALARSRDPERPGRGRRRAGAAQTEFLALEGIGAIANTVERIKKRLNPRLHIAGVILTMVDRRMTLSQQVEADVRQHFGDSSRHHDPAQCAYRRTPSHGLPVLIYDNACAGSQAYILLASEFIRRRRSAAEAAQPEANHEPVP